MLKSNRSSTYSMPITFNLFIPSFYSTNQQVQHQKIILSVHTAHFYFLYGYYNKSVIICLISIIRLVFKSEAACVYCAVRTVFLNTCMLQVHLRLHGVKNDRRIIKTFNTTIFTIKTIFLFYKLGKCFK